MNNEIRIPGGFEVNSERIIRASFAGESYDWGALMLYADQMHAAGMFGQGATACVLDTGYFQHPDLPDDIEIKSFVKGEGPEDKSGHGTHVRGIINMQSNGTGLIGMAPQATVHVGKVLGNSGFGKPVYGENGLRWAIRELKVDVINMSLAMPGEDATWSALLEEAEADGITVVAASGNTSRDFSFFPASHRSVIGVNAVNDKDQLAPFSNKGKANIAAPGVQIRSAWIDGDYRKANGTSMAAPHVTGMILLMINWHVHKFGYKPSPAKIKTLLCAFAKDLGEVGPDLDFGCGRITNGWAGMPTPNGEQPKGCLFPW